MIAIRCALEPPFLPRLHAVFTHQPRCAPAANGETTVLKLPRHARTAIGAIGQREGRTDMCKHYQITTLPCTSAAASIRKIATLAHAENFAKPLDGELVLRLIDQRKPHRLPSLAKKL
jgi:hypothetical protein